MEHGLNLQALTTYQLKAPFGARSACLWRASKLLSLLSLSISLSLQPPIVRPVNRTDLRTPPTELS